MKDKGWAVAKLLWFAKGGLLCCAVLGLMISLPAIAGAQMTVKVETVFSTENGLVRLETDYRSLFSDARLEGVRQNQYFNDVIGNGGAVTVGAEFQNKGNSEIAVAGITILKEPSKTLDAVDATVLRAVEKVGTSSERPGDSFGASGGSQIRVTETLHATSASTLNGSLVYLVQSQGEGQMSAGVAGEFNKECVECETPEKSGKGTMEDVRLQTGVQSASASETLKAGFQRADTHIEMSGSYSAAFQGVIELTK